MVVKSELQNKGIIGDVALGVMKTRPGVSQREYNHSWAMEIAESFDIDKIGLPTVNKIGNHYFVIDGWHRVNGIRIWYGEGWEKEKISCVIYKNLKLKQEADLFLSLNFVKAVHAFEKFLIALTAGREIETNINAIVKKNGIKVSRSGEEGCIACVGALMSVYRKGSSVLDRDLSILWKSFGDAGLTADLIRGIGLLVNRYEDKLNDKTAIRALGAMRGSSNALLQRAERLKISTGAQRAHCIAAAAVETINRATTNKKDKLEGWWKVQEA
jgi:hypothetical protein